MLTQQYVLYLLASSKDVGSANPTKNYRRSDSYLLGMGQIAHPVLSTSSSGRVGRCPKASELVFHSKLLLLQPPDSEIVHDKTTLSRCHLPIQISMFVLQTHNSPRRFAITNFCQLHCLQSLFDLPLPNWQVAMRTVSLKYY